LLPVSNVLRDELQVKNARRQISSNARSAMLKAIRSSFSRTGISMRSGLTVVVMLNSFVASQACINKTRKESLVDNDRENIS
jgi:hypothetical protein